MNKRLTTDMADANGLQRAIRPTGFFNFKKMSADFCSAQCVMDITGYLKYCMKSSEIVTRLKYEKRLKTPYDVLYGNVLFI